MPDLYHHPLCPHSRYVRLILGELGIAPTLIEERVYERREAFLLMNPAGRTPVLVDATAPPVPGWAPIGEYVDETRGLALGLHRLLPESPAARVEVRRLLDWFNTKFFDEVSGLLVAEKVTKRYMTPAQGGGGPNMDAVRVARANIRHHLRYIGYLVRTRDWLGGRDLTYADLAAAAQLSSVDFLGDVPWSEDETAKSWYARIKSRPAFRPLLADRQPGLPPAPHYDDLDF